MSESREIVYVAEWFQNLCNIQEVLDHFSSIILHQRKTNQYCLSPESIVVKQRGHVGRLLTVDLQTENACQHIWALYLTKPPV